jgi:hypothetical protein
MTKRGWIFLVGAALLSSLAQAQSITLSPAVVPLTGKRGQGITHTLTLRNDSSVPLSFVMEARDLVVREGRRAEVEAGRLPDSVAASALFSEPRLTVPAQSQGQVSVTLTLPPTVSHRAVNVYFRGDEPVRAGRSQALLSLGTLFTFTLSDEIALTADALHAAPPSATRDLEVSLHLANSGREPVVPTGVLAILDAGGRLQGKQQLKIARLLPGELTSVVAAYAGELPPGTYQVVATLEAAGHPLTRQATVTVP